jgi:hypothetical protein
MPKQKFLFSLTRIRVERSRLYPHFSIAIHAEIL